MLRCSQAVIVGDPEQLPPTDFFSAGDDGDPAQAEDAPEELILELGRRCWHPMRMLEVHYRSRHHSLIAYSNREFMMSGFLSIRAQFWTTRNLANLAGGSTARTKPDRAAMFRKRARSLRKRPHSCARALTARSALSP
jgi:hypothetical protein